jgi:hypothetical protein
MSGAASDMKQLKAALDVGQIEISGVNSLDRMRAIGPLL